jgi:hypothetical protein
MCRTSIAKHFEPIEHNFLSIGLENESFALHLFFKKIQNFEILYDLVFDQIHPMNIYFEWDMFLMYKIFKSII